jgi:predicted NBD/HSP70 family sugar kinase
VQVVAADIGVELVQVALVGLGGVVLTRRARPLGASRPEDVVVLLRDLVREVLADPVAGRLVLGLGVSLPGVVRRSDGCVRFAPNLGWTDEPLGRLLALALGDLPVRIANDADLGVLAEHRRGCARGIDDVVFVAGEVGVGGGLIVGGRPLLGWGGYAGEIGHMTVRPGGRACRCGSRGCWETEIGAPALSRALGADHAGGAELVGVLRSAAAAGAPGLAEVGHYLGLGLGTLVNLVNPRLVVLGGLLREVYPHVADAVSEGLRASALRAPAEEVQLALPQLGGDAVLVGAAELVWDEVLADPATTLRRAAR